VSLLLHRQVADSVRYGVAVGKVRVLETRVLGAATYERLVDAATFAEQKRIISDTVYGTYLESSATADDVETGLDAALDDFYRFLDEANLPVAVTHFFRVRYDFWNLRAALKARALGVASTGMLSSLGTVPADAFGDPLDGLPPMLGEVARALVPASGEPWPEVATIDAVVEQALFAELSRTARESKSAFLRSLAALNIDVANAKTAILAKRRGMPAAELASLLLEGGALPRKRVEELLELPADELVEGLAGHKALAGISANQLADPGLLDVAVDNLVVRFLRRARHVPVGPEPVVAYVMAREAEVVSVRTLLVGKLAGLSQDALRARLRELYV